VGGGDLTRGNFFAGQKTLLHYILFIHILKFYRRRKK